MPRRQFQADLAKAVEGASIAGISNVQSGSDDGEFTFSCQADDQELSISVLIPELSDYPSNHICMIYGADNASTAVASALDDLTDSAMGKSVSQILELVARRLDSMDDDGDQHMLDSQDFDDFSGAEDDDSGGEEYFPGDEDLLPQPMISHSLGAASGGDFTGVKGAFRQRIRIDLMIAKSAGFKVGHQGGLMDGLGCYVSLSIRVAKLGISEEAMQAWQVEPSEYLVAIFHYPAGYKSMDDIKSDDVGSARRNFGVRVGICTTYKPSLQEAVQAFTVLIKEEEKRREESQQADSQQADTMPKGFRNSFISRPLNELLDQRLHMLIKYRYGGMPWNGAEMFYNDQVLNAANAQSDASNDKYFEAESVSTAWPKIVTEDHIQSSSYQEHSLPLVGMQFVLRHFVRCTEFCLICFSKMPDDLQAIKPYVCDNPLCLYQYMSLGFGPSIEHEILSQPKVVDLLVSFCYASARQGRLRDFPTGLSLAVPPSTSNDRDYACYRVTQNYGFPVAGVSNVPPQMKIHKPIDPEAISMKYNADTREMLFDNKSHACPIVNGTWIVIRVDDQPTTALYCRVIDTSLYPSVKVSEPATPTLPDTDSNDPYCNSRAKSPRLLLVPETSQCPSGAKEFRSANFHVFNQNFDDLHDQQKRQAIAALLDLLPPIRDMRKFLLRRAQSTLNAWVDRLPPAVLGILRWIIASNRACILQVESEEDGSNGRKAEDRLYGMAGWAQFRFAMGAPDKERRFIQAVKSSSERLHLKYPTLFAWHGSPLQNWHSIIREGLHFNDTAHGRAFGNGVYHAPDVNTSLGYSNLNYAGTTWATSELKIQQALALNEIVNVPSEYVSQSPHYVVAQLDWIQTRYLFVKTNTGISNTGKEETKPLECVEQDPKRTPRGVGGDLIIPIHAVAASRRPKSKLTTKNKRQKAAGSNQWDPIEINDDSDTASIATLEEDRIIFDTEDMARLESTMNALPTPNSINDDKTEKGKSKISNLACSLSSKLFGSKSTILAKPLTDYVPGTLDYDTLPMLQQPSWAAISATKRLMKDFKDIIEIQNTQPLHELGWHLDEEKIENMYQWIVELHSFDPALPLAQDMKKKAVKSIVLELRFGKDYPMSPPFVRVIRPRFLGFQQGGGGHVTAGGAMCMQLLTNDGWSAVSSIESVLLQVRMAMSSLDPKPARLQNGGEMDYGVGEAVEAYIRACNMHGWTVPEGFREMAYGGGSTGGMMLLPF